LIVTLTAQNACYVYVPPASAAPEAGLHYKFLINDQGRVVFANRVGPGVTSIEGSLVDQNSDAFVVSVATVESISSPPSHWTGEQLTVNKQYVSAIRERQLSRSRTAVAFGVAVGTIAAFFVTRALVGGGSDTRGGGEGPPPGSSIIIPIPK
jgi:hypothetical protein